MNKPKHSIIVPVYNTGLAICKCIESVLQQTYNNFELIIIDDGSKDATASIIDKYAMGDSRIKAIHIPNAGVSNARNVGLDIASGEYIMFIDSDDWIERDYLEQIEKRMVDESDIYIVGITQDFEFPDGTLSHSKVKVAPVYQKINPEKLADEFGYLLLTVNMASACLKTYRRSFIEQNMIRFDRDMFVLEDYYFVLHCLVNKPQISLLPYIGYHYRLPVILNVEQRRGNRDFYLSVSKVLGMLDYINKELRLSGHSYKVFLKNAQDIIGYALRQSKTAKPCHKSKYFSRIACNPFFIKYSEDLMKNGGGRFALQCKLMKLHLYNLAYWVYRYI